MIKVTKEEAKKLAVVLRTEVNAEARSMAESIWFQRPERLTAAARKAARARYLERRAQWGRR